MQRRELEQRRAYRAWIRANHPDVGGDAWDFAAGLARWRRRPGEARRGAPAVTIYHRPRTPIGEVLWRLARRRSRRARARWLR